MKTDPLQLYDYMLPRKEQVWETESYVSSPPAALITDERNCVWTLDNDFHMGPHGEYAFSVLCNGRRVGEIASRIERRRGKIRIYTTDGLGLKGFWKQWNGHSFF